MLRKPSATRPTAWRLRANVAPGIGDNEEMRTPQLSFTYLNAEQSAAMEQEREEARRVSLSEYQELKALLLRRTWRFGTLFAGYLLLTISSEAAFLELIGAATSYGYLLWLMKDVDSYSEDTEVPMRAAEAVEPGTLRYLSKLGAAYRQSLNPRLLIPVGLVAGCVTWNATFPDIQISVVDEGCLIGGFLSYKIALILKIYDDLRPRALTEEEMLQASRPQLAEVEDVPLEFKSMGTLAGKDNANKESDGNEGM